MASIWNSHQRCACGWAGSTRAHRLNIISGLSYVSAALALVALDAFEVVSLRSLSWTLGAPLLVAALAWYGVVPSLLWKGNRCPRCGTALAVDLISGKPGSTTTARPQ